MNTTNFTESDFDELEQILLSDYTPDSCMDIVTLEGFLTALIIGPVTVLPSKWLPFIWSGSTVTKKKLKFETEEELQRFFNLIMGLYNDIIHHFSESPDDFEPTFYERKVKGKTYTIVDEWCDGFLKGIKITGKAWQPLIKKRPDLLRPIKLFATREGWKKLEEAEDEEAMHEEWSVKIAPAVREIYKFWLPYRRRGS